MIEIRSRRLVDVAFLPELGAFSAHVSVTYSFADDPGRPLTARLPVTVEMDPRTRFTRIEAALLAGAARMLLQRFAMLEPPPRNIFADLGDAFGAGLPAAA